MNKIRQKAIYLRLNLFLFWIGLLCSCFETEDEDCQTPPGWSVERGLSGSYLSAPAELVIDSARTSFIEVEIYKNDKLDSSYSLGRIDSSLQATLEYDDPFFNYPWEEDGQHWQSWATQRVSVELQLYTDSTFELNYYHHLPGYEVYRRFINGDLEETQGNQFSDSTHYGDFTKLSTNDYMLIHSGGRKQPLRFVLGELLEVREEHQYEVDGIIYRKILIADDFEVEIRKPDPCAEWGGF